VTEPKVEFFLREINDRPTQEQFEQLRAWHEFREDNAYPSVKTFTGTLGHQEERYLYVDGFVYGYSGMTQNQSLSYWAPMLYSVAFPSGQCFFALEQDNEFGNYVKIRCQNVSNTKSLGYRVTLFYRGA